MYMVNPKVRNLMVMLELETERAQYRDKGFPPSRTTLSDDEVPPAMSYVGPSNVGPSDTGPLAAGGEQERDTQCEVPHMLSWLQCYSNYATIIPRQGEGSVGVPGPHHQ